MQLFMILFMVLQTLLNLRLFTLKKSVDRVTGNFVLRVVALVWFILGSVRFVPAYAYRTSEFLFQ